MTKDKIKLIHGIYAIIMSVLLIGIALALILSCIHIYQSGARPFSRESIGTHFRLIAIPFYITVAFAVGSFLLNLILPREKKKLGSKVSDSVTAKRWESKVAGYSIPEALSLRINREITLRKWLIIANILLYVAGLAASLAYLFNNNHFPGNAINREVLLGFVSLATSLLIPFVFSIVLAFVLKASYRRETELLKEAFAQKTEVAENAPQKKTVFTRVSNSMAKNGKYLRLAAQGTLLLVGTVFVIIGIINGGASDVVQKAIKICTECIGLG